MSNMKALKDFETKTSRFYLWWLDTRISKYYYDFMHTFIENPIFQVKRLYQWYVNVFRYDFDFDGHSMFAIIEYKLKRILPVLEKGLAQQEDRDMKALKLAIKLAGRLKENKYDSVAYDRHEKKWGTNPQWFYGAGTAKRAKMNQRTIEKVDRVRDEYWARILAADARMKREERILYAILLKYLRVWWD